MESSHSLKTLTCPPCPCQYCSIFLDTWWPLSYQFEDWPNASKYSPFRPDDIVTYSLEVPVDGVSPLGLNMVDDPDWNIPKLNGCIAGTSAYATWHWPMPMKKGGNFWTFPATPTVFVPNERCIHNSSSLSSSIFLSICWIFFENPLLSIQRKRQTPWKSPNNPPLSSPWNGVHLKARRQRGKDTTTTDGMYSMPGYA